MREEGILVSFDGTSAVIETEQKEECTKCCSCKASSPRRIRVSLEKVRGINVGDKVYIDMDPRAMMRVYMLLYAIPLVSFVFGIIVLYAATVSPVISFMGAIIITIAAYGIIGRYIGKTGSFSPKIHPKR